MYHSPVNKNFIAGSLYVCFYASTDISIFILAEYIESVICIVILRNVEAVVFRHRIIKHK